MKKIEKRENYGKIIKDYNDVMGRESDDKSAVFTAER